MLIKRLLRRLADRWLGPSELVPLSPPPPGEAAPNVLEDAAPPTGLPEQPEVRAVLVKQEDAHVLGVPGLHFRRREVTTRDAQNAKYTHFETNPIVLGCGCMVSSPRDVAYISDISGRPVCRRCAKWCICGHKTAPTERVQIPEQGFLCIACHQALAKAQWKARIIRFFLGAFVKGPDGPPRV